MARPDERRFVTFRRGEVRDKIILAQFRNGLRSMTNPDTGATFTEDEIARATQPGSRYYIEADAIDLYGQSAQQRGAWFVDQIFPRRASSGYLEGVHQPLWLPEGKLPAAGALGKALAKAPSGTIWNGSTTIPDPAARVARDPTGRRYQVYVTATTPASGEVTLTMRAIDGGDASNIDVGTKLKWANPPTSAEPEAEVSEKFDGGADAETDAEFALRIEDAMRFRPGAGNRAHFRAWALSASSAIGGAFIYANGLHAGSVVVAIVQKRASTSIGPLARIPSLATLTDATAYLVPPASPVVPGNVHVLLVPPVSQPTSVALKLGLARGSAGGWTDSLPWPSATAIYPLSVVTQISSQTLFRITTDSAPPFALPASGTSLPRLMMWNSAMSRYEALQISSITLFASNVYEVTLASPPTFTFALGAAVCPHTDRLDVIAEAVEAHFDSLGPGEVVDLSADVRAHRAYRFPRQSGEFPSKLNFRLVSNLLEDLGGAADDGDLFASIPFDAPQVPTSVSDGPAMLTLNQLGLYDLED